MITFVFCYIEMCRIPLKALTILHSTPADDQKNHTNFSKSFQCLSLSIHKFQSDGTYLVAQDKPFLYHVSRHRNLLSKFFMTVMYSTWLIQLRYVVLGGSSYKIKLQLIQQISYTPPPPTHRVMEKTLTQIILNSDHSQHTIHQ